MTETQRLAQVKTALQAAVINTVEAESRLEDAAELAVEGSVKADKIWDLKVRLNRLGIEILELSKT